MKQSKKLYSALPKESLKYATEFGLNIEHSGREDTTATKSLKRLKQVAFR